jgi:tRNA G18 (ribose-2'-O)-methylase SpoU
MKRSLTRRNRYDQKLKSSKWFPIELCAINFKHDANLGFLIRAAACFGIRRINVIGDCPPRSILNPLSGSLYDYIEIKKYSRPCEFMDYAKAEGLRVVSAELSENSTPIDVFTFDYSSRLVLVVGQEHTGVPIEILKNSDQVYIPMPGPGFCLNTSQAANILLYEAVKQYETKVKGKNQTLS